MSRLIDKLTKMRQSEPQPLGFMLGRGAAEKPKLQLIASVSVGNLDAVSSGLKPADSVIIEITKADDTGALEKVCQDKDVAPGGGWLKATNGGTLKKLMNTACDFAVFQPTAQLSVVHKDKIGRVLELDPSLSEGLLRAANELPVDAVLVSGKESENALTLNRLMLIQRLAYMVNKPILVPVLINSTEPELQALWDMGIGGVIVAVEDEKSIEKLSELRKAIDKLVPPARKKGKSTAILPRVQSEAPKPEEGEEEEEDE